MKSSFVTEMSKMAMEGHISLPTPLRLALLQKALESKDTKKKEAGVLKNVGSMARTLVGDTASNFGGALASMGKPMQAMKAGWNTGGWSRASELAATGELSKLTPGRQAFNKYMPGSKALTLGTTALTVPGAVSSEDPTGQGRSRAERIGALAGGTALGLAAAPFNKGGNIPSLVAGTAASMLGDTVGGKMGKAVGKLQKRKLPKYLEAPAPSEHSLSEYANDGPSASATRTERTI